MRTGSLQDARGDLAAQRLGGLVADANVPVATERQLQRELDEKIRDYIEVVEAAETLPPNAFLAGFFTLSLPVTEMQEGLGGGLAPVAPLHQDSSLFDMPNEPAVKLWEHVMPDEGRRVQLWPDELAAGSPPLRPDEVVRFVARGEWLGRVDRISGDRFDATLWGRDRPDVEERAAFFLGQLSDGDRLRVTPGSEFYWSVGYFENNLGERFAGSRIWVRRTLSEPLWKLDPDIEAEADAIAALFGTSNS